MSCLGCHEERNETSHVGGTIHFTRGVSCSLMRYHCVRCSVVGWMLEYDKEKKREAPLAVKTSHGGDRSSLSLLSSPPDDFR